MAQIAFDDSLKVGVTFVDSQHRALIDQINALDTAMREGKSKDVIHRTIANLIVYTQRHFTEEERAMLKSGYPDYEGHKRQHDAFVDRIKKFQADLNGGSRAVPVEVMAFLGEWLTRHIKGTDKRYIPSFKASGLAV